MKHSTYCCGGLLCRRVLLSPVRHSRPEKANTLGLHKPSYSLCDALVEPPEQDRSHHDGRVDAEPRKESCRYEVFAKTSEKSVRYLTLY